MGDDIEVRVDPKLGTTYVTIREHADMWLSHNAGVVNVHITTDNGKGLVLRLHAKPVNQLGHLLGRLPMQNEDARR